MLDLCEVKEVNNLIFNWVRQVQVIDNSKINDEIKSMYFDVRRIFGYKERVIYYDKAIKIINGKKYNSLKKIIMPCCCMKCGNYFKNNFKKFNNKILCKCNHDDYNFITIFDKYDKENY